MTNETPLYATKESVLAAPGEIYQHYKGGVMRLIARGVRHSETLEIGVLYEHIWPEYTGYWFRPEEMFFGVNEKGEQRFVLVKKE